ncbi:MAG: cobalamin biosynthesis protein CobD [Actinobacteria bacterium HGW-Actinobacteria-10]|nr:MAG: cobalamin biosynthesis protein CobD [Actinobacteria bacterium HGW-Actinobacteria-10]
MVAVDALTGRALAIGLAFALDLLLGDPPNRFHPVAWLGSLIGSVERALRRSTILDGRFGGFVLVGIIVSASVSTAYSLSMLGWKAGPVAGIGIDGVLIWLTISARTLANEGRNVALQLERDDLSAARRQVGRIVGRRTDSLDSPGVARAAVESLGENFVDGVLAPLLWGAALGPLGAWLHKSASTLDSMVGYKTDRYRDFGFAAARLDDLLTWLPARSSLLIVPLAAAIIGGNMGGAWVVGGRDRHNHASPNSAHGEAAFAGALGVRLGGPLVYADGIHDHPVIGKEGGIPTAGSIRGAARLVIASGMISTLGAAGMLWTISAAMT